MTGFFWLLFFVVMFAIFGGALFTTTWWLIGYAIVGLIIGGFARLLVAGTWGLGMGVTMLSGVAGSIFGGLIAQALELGDILELLVSILVAAVFVAGASAGMRSRS